MMESAMMTSPLLLRVKSPSGLPLAKLLAKRALALLILGAFAVLVLTLVRIVFFNKFYLQKDENSLSFIGIVNSQSHGTTHGRQFEFI